jgi:hypothetical protein
MALHPGTTEFSEYGVIQIHWGNVTWLKNGDFCYTASKTRKAGRIFVRSIGAVDKTTSR